MNSNVRFENGIVIGTSNNKYGSKNPLAKRMLAGFDNTICDLAAKSDPKFIFEAGCGEGHIVKLLLQKTQARILATDFSRIIVEEARATVRSDRVRFEVANVMEVQPLDERPDLVVCCEVMEHLEEPSKALSALAAMRGELYLFSVPREPIWRILNMARGAYLSDFGNSPGHLQHWSRRGFIRFLKEEFDLVEVRSPLPWTAILCRLRNGRGR
jgi:2-polyprenyl-3-methyl-5-hydroxy-6-metoxy-1,4-benzoquinol methylase